MIKKAVISLVVVLMSLATSAQPNLVKWKATTSHIKDNIYEIVLDAKIGKGWHMYDMGPYELNGPNATIVKAKSLDGAIKQGNAFQKTKPTKVFDEVYKIEIGYFEGHARFAQKVKLTKDEATIKMYVEWMICDDTSCMPPTDSTFTIKIKSEIPIEASAETTVDTATIVEETPVIVADTTNNQAVITPATEGKQGNSLWSVIIEAILWGFAALLTPCVFPMIPMTVSFFMKGSGSPAAARAKAFSYGLFIVVLYTLPIAAIILITRILGGDSVTADIFNWLSTHWLPNMVFFIVFMIFAASFFGAFEISLPSSMVNKSDQNADKKGLVGIFFMALTLVLVSFSCTGPIVGSVLIKSTSGEFWEPIVTMFAFSVAFALPFTIFAMFPSLLKNLPKSGGWLNSVKVVLGFLEVALGLKFFSVADQTYHWGILDREVYLAIWIVVFTLLGLYLLGKIRFANDDEVKHLTVTRLALSIASLSFVVYLLPGMWGAPLKALSGYMPPIHTQDFVMGGDGAMTINSPDSNAKTAKYSDFLSLPHGLSGYFDFNEAMAAAKAQDKPLFVDVTGHGCVNCREMEARVWSDPKVLQILRNDYVIVALYTDDKKTLPESDWITADNGNVLQELGRINAYIARKKWGVNAQPNYILLGKDGVLLAPARGYNLDVNAFVEFLENGVKEYKK
ncbi:MAG: cytochrome c biogenesis protein CcdA [Rikenellaceae bacterium]